MAPMAVRAQRALVHVDNIDSAAAAELVAELADALAGVPMLVTERLSAPDLIEAARQRIAEIAEPKSPGRSPRALYCCHTAAL